MHRWITTIKATGLKYYTVITDDGKRLTHTQGVEDFNKDFFRPTPNALMPVRPHYKPNA